LPRAIILPGRELPKPRQNRAGADDLAATLPFLGREGLALERQPASLLGRECNPRLAGGCSRRFPKYTRTSSWTYSSLRAIRSLIA
jgi:hypothetical protein